MKILKYTILFSTLIGIFFIVYQQSDKKGLDRLKISLKITAIIIVALAEFITNPVKAIEPDASHNSTSIERALFNQELDSLDDPNSRVVLVRTGDSSPSPSVPTSRGHGVNAFPTGSTGRPRNLAVDPYRTPPKVVNQGLGAAGAGNGGGGGNNPINNNDIPPSDKLKADSEFWKEYQPYYNKNKKSSDQCELDENSKPKRIKVVSLIKENKALIEEAARMGKDKKIQKDIYHLVDQLSLGNHDPGIGTRQLKGLKYVLEARGKNGARVYFRYKNGNIEILAKSDKNNQDVVINILKNMDY